MSLWKFPFGNRLSSLSLATTRDVHQVDFCTPLIFIHPAWFRGKLIEEFYNLVMRAFDQVVRERTIKSARSQADMEGMDQLIDTYHPCFRGSCQRIGTQVCFDGLHCRCTQEFPVSPGFMPLVSRCFPTTA